MSPALHKGGKEVTVCTCFFISSFFFFLTLSLVFLTTKCKSNWKYIFDFSFSIAFCNMNYYSLLALPSDTRHDKLICRYFHGYFFLQVLLCWLGLVGWALMTHFPISHRSPDDLCDISPVCYADGKRQISFFLIAFVARKWAARRCCTVGTYGNGGKAIWIRQYQK